MNDITFDHLIRLLSTPFARRGTPGILVAALTGALPTDEVAAGCGPCRKKRRGRCGGKRPDGTPCQGDGQCLNGRCNQPPVCIVAHSLCSPGAHGSCCSGFCGSAAQGSAQCVRGEAGSPCYGHFDCLSGRCVGYRCAGDLDCAGEADGTRCAVDKGCSNGQCAVCWATATQCCEVAGFGSQCTLGLVCTGDGCCPESRACDGRCLGTGCEDRCYRTCASQADCCAGLACTLVQEQGGDVRRCVPA